MNFDIRKQLIDFDNVINKQREAVYGLRNKILDGKDITSTIKDMIDESIKEKVSLWAVGKYLEEWDWASIKAWLLKTFDIKYEIKNRNEISFVSKETVQSDIFEEVLKAYDRRQEQLTTEVMFNFQRIIFLQMIDSSWKDHLYELDQLRHGIGYMAYAQKDPKIEYQKESFVLFEFMMKRIRENTIKYMFKVQVDIKLYEILKSQDFKSDKVNFNFERNILDKQNKFDEDLSKIKIGRNNPCPCGSGKKYKRCCGGVS